MPDIDREALRSGADQIGTPLTDSQLAQFALFSTLLQDWNQRINLTRIAPEDFVTLHFLDSLLALKSVDFLSGARVIDVGTGAGFPGIPLKIARPDLKLTLLDATRKKLTFVEEAIRALDLKDCITVHARAEDAAKLQEHRSRYDFAIARAVAKLDKLAAWMLPLVKSGGSAVAMKSSDVSDEITAAIPSIKLLGGDVNASNFRIPNTQIERAIIVIIRGGPHKKSR
jgi:16S rRNA (guanine527-N7)-methyltransferase